MTAQDAEKFARLLQRMDAQSKLLRAWELKGGVSAQVTALEVESSDGQRQKMIVRVHGDVDFKQNPRIAADEFNLLQILQSEGIAAPKPYFLEVSGEIFGRPCLVMEFVEGQTESSPADLSDYTTQLAAHLARIHRVDGMKPDLAFLPQQAEVYTARLRERPARLDNSIGEGKIRHALEAVWPLAQRNPSALLHSDYWPGNALWWDGQLVAMIDWEDAAIGDPLSDLGNARLEILWAFGQEAMLDFTQQYLSVNALDVTHLPSWDLCAALRPAFKIAEWAGELAREKIMRERHEWFVAEAFEKLETRR